ncbi:unannotated protein [freshwater metagenome]|uniref:Unannotated protein n=1 Tax=freshwater metagenome TaxID=449393 RepID=A0A6J7KUL2_9ZZZZ
MYSANIAATSGSSSEGTDAGFTDSDAADKTDSPTFTTLSETSENSKPRLSTTSSTRSVRARLVVLMVTRRLRAGAGVERRSEQDR